MTIEPVQIKDIIDQIRDRSCTAGELLGVSPRFRRSKVPAEDSNGIQRKELPVIGVSGCERIGTSKGYDEQFAS